MTPRTYAQINLTALKHNLLQAKALASNSRVLAVVKANGYGHGIVAIAQALKQADGFGVATLEEALQLRAAGITQTIVLLEGVVSSQELQQAAENHLDLVIHQSEQLELITKSKLKQALTLWIKFNTGMNRLGFSLQQAKTLQQRLQALPQIKTTRLMSHLACAEQPQHSLTKLQIKQFQQLQQHWPNQPFSLANSAAIMAMPNTHGHWIRPGIMLYGATPLPKKNIAVFKDKNHDNDQLLPVMSLRAHIIAIQHLNKGDTVGYGAHWQAKNACVIAVVSIGYGDGYPRHLPAGTPTYIKLAQNNLNNMQQDFIAPLVGITSMDMLTIDITKTPNLPLNTEVELWGEHIPANHIAQLANTISYELFCQVTPRVPRIYCEYAQ